MTVNISFSYSDTLEKIHLRLEYYAGKRAADGDEFYKLKACELDNPLIREFMDIAVASIRMELGRRCTGFTLAADTLTFTVDTLSDAIGAPGDAAAVAMQNYVVESVVAKWLSMAGISFDAAGLDTVKALLEMPAETLKPLKAAPRKFPPI